MVNFDDDNNNDNRVDDRVIIKAVKRRTHVTNLPRSKYFFE